MSTKHLTNLKTNANDEWYTTRRNIQTTMELTITDQLKDKIIYLPADSDESEIYKYLVETKDKYQYKELIHTSDDFRTHEDLFEYCDIVLTNPPFSLTQELLNIIDKYNKDYFLYNYPIKWLNVKTFRKHYIEGKLKLLYTPYCREFKKPNGTVEDQQIFIFTTLIDRSMYFNNDLTLRKFSLTKKFEDIKHEFEDNSGILNIDRISDLPYDYDDYILCTLKMIPFYVADNLITLINTDELKAGYIININNKKIQSDRLTVNGKSKFYRVLIKIKH